MSPEAREIADAIRAAYRERTGAASLPEALDAAREADGCRWAVAGYYEHQFAARLKAGGIRIWWRKEFSAPEWQPYDATMVPPVLWRPADPDNLPPRLTLPVVAPASSPG